MLVVAAHPDDVDFGVAGVGGALDRRRDGRVSTASSPTATPEGPTARSAAGMARLRRDEQRAAAAVVGVHDVRFLGYPDGGVVASSELRRDICRVVRTLRPERVVCQSPGADWDTLGASHPDHLAAGEATVGAFYPDARNPFAHPRAPRRRARTPQRCGSCGSTAHPEANRAVDVTASFDRKIAALRCHVSQVGGGEWLAERVGHVARDGASRAGLPTGASPRLFRVVTAP